MNYEEQGDTLSGFKQITKQRNNNLKVHVFPFVLIRDRLLSESAGELDFCDCQVTRSLLVGVNVFFLVVVPQNISETE